MKNLKETFVLYPETMFFTDVKNKPHIPVTKTIWNRYFVYNLTPLDVEMEILIVKDLIYKRLNTFLQC